MIYKYPSLLFMMQHAELLPVKNQTIQKFDGMAKPIILKGRVKYISYLKFFHYKIITLIGIKWFHLLIERWQLIFHGKSLRSPKDITLSFLSQSLSRIRIMALLYPFLDHLFFIFYFSNSIQLRFTYIPNNKIKNMLDYHHSKIAWVSLSFTLGFVYVYNSLLHEESMHEKMVR